MHKTVAIIFDFDDTLAPDSVTAYLSDLGIDTASFWDTEVNRKIKQEGWDPAPAYIHQMLEYMYRYKIPNIQEKSLESFGQRMTLYPGLSDFFDGIRAFVESSAPPHLTMEVEFYLISSGIGSIIRHTSIAHHFTNIWASELFFNAQGVATFPKRVLSFSDKTRYLFHIAKGLTGTNSTPDPFLVNRKQAIRVPFDQMIFIGDGFSDIPCFSIVKQYGGHVVGVYGEADRTEIWKTAQLLLEDRRVDVLVQTDYRPHSALTQHLQKVLLKLIEHSF